MTKCLFLDRDGVINIDVGYACQPEQIRFVPDIFELCRFFQRQGYIIIIVTNQSGIARNYYTEQDFHHLNDWMKKIFSIRGVNIQDTYFCPHHPTLSGPCDCRKPEPGMLLNAIKKYHIHPKVSIMIGDKISDLQAALSAGVATRIWFKQNRQSVDKEGVATLAINNHRKLLMLCRSNKLQSLELNVD